MMRAQTAGCRFGEMCYVWKSANVGILVVGFAGHWLCFGWDGGMEGDFFFFGGFRQYFTLSPVSGGNFW